MSSRAAAEWVAGAAARVLALAMAVCGAPAALCQSATHSITDMSGTVVAVPVKIERIAEQFPAHTVTDILLGAGDRLVAIPQNVKTIPLLRRIHPPIVSVPELFRSGAPVNMEDLLSHHPDVVSVGGNGAAALLPFRNAGLPAVSMGFTTFEQLRQSITLAGAVYGGSSPALARSFLEYFDARYRDIRARLAGLAAGERPRVAHISGAAPLVIDGGGTLIDEWITLGGGTNAAAGVAGNHAGITMEQLLRWDPDVLIVQTPGGDQGLAAGTGQSVIAALAAMPGWGQLKAVRTGRVHLNPQGMYPWERYGPEEALQIQWVAKTLHPQRFKDLDLRAEARHFYRTFFHYCLSEAELDQVFQVKP